MLSRCCGGLGFRQGLERVALALAGGRAGVVSLEPGGRWAGKQTPAPRAAGGRENVWGGVDGGGGVRLTLRGG